MYILNYFLLIFIFNFALIFVIILLHFRDFVGFLRLFVWYFDECLFSNEFDLKINLNLNDFLIKIGYFFYLNLNKNSK